MKKILYGLFFTFIFLISVNNVYAVNKTCYYKGENGKLDFKINVNSNGRGEAILQKSYTKGDNENNFAFRESQEAGAKWKIKDALNSNGDCKKYFIYDMKIGNNKIKFIDDITMILEDDTYLLKKEINNETNQESNKYAKIECNYILPDGIGNVKFFAESDGEKVIVDRVERIKLKQGQKPATHYRYTSLNFVSNNKLVCPISMHYTKNNLLYNFSFEYNEGSNEIIIDYNNSNESNKPVYIKDEPNVKSCVYSNENINVLTDGKKIWYENIHPELSQVDPENFDVTIDDFKNGNCPELYFDCEWQGSSNHKCSVSVEKNDGLSGNHHDGEDGKYADELAESAKLTSKRYGKLLGALKKTLLPIQNNVWENYQITINRESTTLGKIHANDVICNEEIKDDCFKEPKFYIEKGIRNIRYYCIEVYKSYTNNPNESIENLVDDCMNFEKNVYERMVEDGIIGDQSKGCELFSNEMSEFILKILSIIKILGPILAIGLGTMDFVKAVASGDAEKEMKTAMTKFTKRIIAAVLLFLIPFVLAFLLDLFFKNEEGYDPENPFCVPIDWTKK